MAGGKSREQLNEVAGGVWQSQQELLHLRRRLIKAENEIAALRKVLTERLQVPPETLEQALLECEQQQSTARTAPTCSQCGRHLQEHVSNCIYCGYAPVKEGKDST